MHARCAPGLPHAIAAATLALLLTACGGGGGTSQALGGAPSGLTITTTSLPGAIPNTPYTTGLQASGASGDVTWTKTSGVLPAGIGLSTAGVLSGTPTVTGDFVFTVGATDGVDGDTQQLTLSVGNLTFQVTAGLVFGDAWTGQPVSVSVGGQTASVSFSVVTNESGGAFTSTDGGAGTATWTPGATGGASVSDRLRATDTGSGLTVDLDVDVKPSPAASHTAAFGASDVWWIDATRKSPGHAYATDWHKALADVGLRGAGSTDAGGTQADQIADAWMRVEILRRLNPLFLREADGSEGTGLAITFPFTEPGAGYTKPPAAGWLNGSPTRYSQIELTEGSNEGVIGTAYLDDGANSSHENDTTSGNTELGIFLNQIVPLFNTAWSNTLDNAPIGAGDVSALKALLYDLPNPGGRYLLIRDIGTGLAKTLAAILAHEVGHSLGLDHTNPPQSGSIMNPSASISRGASYAFISADVTALQGALPGVGKSSSNLTAGTSSSKAGLPAGGVCVCRGEAAAR